MVFAYATGFNAHKQLISPSAANGSKASDDIRVWTSIAQGSRVKVVFAGWSSTVLLIENQIIFRGYRHGIKTLPIGDISLDSQIKSVHGDLNGPLGLLTSTGRLFIFAFVDDGDLFAIYPIGDATSPTLSQVAIAGNGKTAITMLQASGSNMIHVLEFPTYRDFEKWYADPSGGAEGEKGYMHYMLSGRVKTLIGCATCFILLTEEGNVTSWGDGRHPRCLGRTPSSVDNAAKPCQLSALGGVKISKIDGRGWAFGALSEDGDLYLWGRDKPGIEGPGLSSLLGGADEEVKLLDEFEDVKDFAVGNGHVLVLSGSNELWGIGVDSNGQLGWPANGDEGQSKWIKLLSLPKEEKHEIIAGDLTSFVVTDAPLANTRSEAIFIDD